MSLHSLVMRPLARANMAVLVSHTPATDHEAFTSLLKLWHAFGKSLRYQVVNKE